MMPGAARDLVFALIAALVVGTATWLWGRTRPWLRLRRAGAWLWTLHQRKQLEEIAELRRDVDALLCVLDHWVTPGAGDKQRQFEYMAEVLRARVLVRRPMTFSAEGRPFTPSRSAPRSPPSYARLSRHPL